MPFKTNKFIRIFLQNSLKAQAQQFNRVFSYGKKISTQKLPTDEDTITNFMKTLECSSQLSFADFNLLPQNAFRLQNQEIALRRLQKHKSSFVVSKRIIAKENFFDQRTSSLIQNSEDILLYLELLQYLELAETNYIQTIRNRLSYLGKWLIHIKNSEINTHISKTYAINLFQIIIRKLQQSIKVNHQTENLQCIKIYSELIEIRKLDLAREEQMKGNEEQAVKQFEAIFCDEAMSEKIRLEALEILCVKSEKENNSEYLLTLLKNEDQISFGCKQRIKKALAKLCKDLPTHEI